MKAVKRIIHFIGLPQLTNTYTAEVRLYMFALVRHWAFLSLPFLLVSPDYKMCMAQVHNGVTPKQGIPMIFHKAVDRKVM